MTTMADLVRGVRSRLSGTLTDELNTLAAGYSVGQGQITLTYDSQGLAPGSVICCEENTWYVYAIDASGGKVATVAPSYDGGPDIAKAAGKQVRIQPRVSDWSIFTALRDQIRLMSSPAHGLSIINFWMDLGNTSDLSGQYPPPDGILPSRILAVYGSDGTRWWPIRQFDWTLGSVRIYDDRFSQYCFVYQMPFVEPTGFTDDLVATVGLSTTMLDIPELGAAGMLMMGMENRRNTLSSQGDPRRSTEVNAGSNVGAGRELLRLRDSRIQDEYGRALNVEALAGISI
jgi:hypothetical protein